jgi:hypothetical protein
VVLKTCNLRFALNHTDLVPTTNNDQCKDRHLQCPVASLLLVFYSRAEQPPGVKYRTERLSLDGKVQPHDVFR